MITTLLTLALIFAELSLLSFGGGNTILPEMQRQIVDLHHWMTATEFSAAFALAQAAPGPNLMIVSLLGWRIAGLPGVLVTTIATYAPAFMVTVVAYNLWDRFKDRPFRRIVQAGLVPVTAGLVCSGAAVITAGADTTILLAAVTLIATAATLAMRIHPLLVLGFGAFAGVLGAGWG